MAPERVDVAVGDRTVSISNPDKAYFPDLGERGRKIDLVRYYASAAEIALSAVAGRPTYLQRYPDGIAGEEVYQKRLPPRAPDWLGRVTVTFPGGRKAEVLRPQHPADLVWAAQYGTITLHPWPALASDLDHPDLMRIDLDPQAGTDFSDAVWVGLELLRPMLDELGLVGFPKTSGGRGIHVDVPLTAWVDLPAGSSRCPGDGPRDGATGTRARDVSVVEGGARRACLHRLQPDAARQDDRGCVHGAGQGGCASVDAGDVGRAADSQHDGLHHPHRARSSRRGRRPAGVDA